MDAEVVAVTTEEVENKYAGHEARVDFLGRTPGS